MSLPAHPPVFASCTIRPPVAQYRVAMDGPATTTPPPMNRTPAAPLDAASAEPAQPPSSTEASPPPHLPTDLRAYYRSGPDAESVSLSPQPEPKHVLEQLGPPPFRKTSFPMMGFLASLYEHIAAHVTRQP